jgi:hypothetical protein
MSVRTRPVIKGLGCRSRWIVPIAGLLSRAGKFVSARDLCRWRGRLPAIRQRLLLTHTATRVISTPRITGCVVAAEPSLRRTSGFALKRRAHSRPAIGTIHRVHNRQLTIEVGFRFPSSAARLRRGKIGRRVDTNRRRGWPASAKASARKPRTGARSGATFDGAQVALRLLEGGGVTRDERGSPSTPGSPPRGLCAVGWLEWAGRRSTSSRRP